MSGIKFTTGGTLNNTLTVTGYLYGVEIYGGLGTVTNSGAISATGKFADGVLLEDGGTVTNSSGGSITADASGSYGVFLQDGGGVVNASGATISGNVSAVVVRGATGTLSNSGSLVSAHYTAAQMKDGGTITNTSTGTITGGYRAIYISGGVGHVTNAGTLSAGTQGSVKMTAGGTLDNTASVDGDVRILGGAGTVTNSGTIGGVYLTAGGAIDNKGGATISTLFESGVLLGYNGSKSVGGGTLYNGANATVSGFSGVYAGESAATITNFGSITGTKIVKSAIAGVLRTFGAGVSLNAGGTVLNEAGGSISGQSYGVTIYGSVAKVTNRAGATITGAGGVKVNGGSATLVNSGSIESSKYKAVYFLDGGSVVNGASGTLSGSQDAIYISGGIGNVTNDGSVSQGAVRLAAGGTLTNMGTVAGAVVIEGGEGVVDNSGALQDGVSLLAGGTLVNFWGAGIGGAAYGVYLEGGGSVTNSGTISGTTNAVKFAGSGANTLTLKTGSLLKGSVVGSTAAGATNALVLVGAGDAENAFLNFDTLTVEATAAWRLGGVLTIGATTVSSGTLAIGAALTTAIDEDEGSTVRIVGALTLNGVSTLGGTTNGVGKLALTAGDTTISAGATIGVGRWSILGPTAAITIDGQLTYNGPFRAGSGAVIDMEGAGDFFGLAGTATFSGATLEGEETLFCSATTSVSGLTVEGDAGFSNSVLVSQTGTVTMGGDGSLDNLGSSSVWDLLNNTGIALAQGSAPGLNFFNDGGLFEKTGGAGVSFVAAEFNNGFGTAVGHVLVSSGTLDFRAAVGGTGDDTISGAATLEFGSTVTATQTIDFTGAGGVLDLGSPTGFAATISGFDTIGSNDAVELLGAWKISGFSTTSTQSTLTLLDGASSVSLIFDGVYDKAQFATKVSLGQTTITYT